MEKEESKEKPGFHDDDGGAVAIDDTAVSSSPSPWWLSFTDADPCSLLHHVVRACAGCLLSLCGGGSDDRGDAAGDADSAVTSQRDAEGGSKAAHDWVGASLLTRRRPPGRPGDPRQGRGGSHN